MEPVYLGLLLIVSAIILWLLLRGSLAALFAWCRSRLARARRNRPDPPSGRH